MFTKVLMRETGYATDWAGQDRGVYISPLLFHPKWFHL